MPNIARVRASIELTLLALLAGLYAFSAAPTGGVGATPSVDPRDVRIIDSTPSLGVPCEQQTWPYIHARCLSGGSATAVRTVRPAAEAPELDPRNAAPAIVAAPKPAPAIAEAVPSVPQPSVAPPLEPYYEQPRQRPQQPRYFSPRVNIQ